MHPVFLIRILDPTPFKSNHITFCLGEIQIGSFKEHLWIPLGYWSVEQYEQQWREAIERLKTHNKSCLVVAVRRPRMQPGATLWMLYKEGSKVYIQNKYVLTKRFIKVFKNKPFTLHNCYSVMTKRTVTTEDTMKIAEWEIDLEDVLRFLDEKHKSPHATDNSL